MRARGPTLALPEVPRLRVPFVEDPPGVGGDSRGAAWRRAPAVCLVDVTTGAAPRHGTTVRALHDGERLLLAFHVEDPDIWGSHREHDAPLWEEEVVEIFLDPYGFGRTYYELQVSPRGVTFDAVVVNRAREDEERRDLTTLTQWDCADLEVSVRVDGEVAEARGGPGVAPGRSWDLELAVPLRALAPPALPAGELLCWRANFTRVDRGIEGDELTAWSPTGKADFHVPSRFGWLELAAA